MLRIVTAAAISIALALGAIAVTVSHRTGGAAPAVPDMRPGAAGMPDLTDQSGRRLRPVVSRTLPGRPMYVTPTPLNAPDQRGMPNLTIVPAGDGTHTLELRRR